MNLSPIASRCGLALSLLAAFSIFQAPTPARANVYATNVRLNGGTTNVTLGIGGTVTIGYVLNEDATAGVKVVLKLGTTAVRTIVLTNGGPGALRGTNAVVWDGRDDATNIAASGTYSVNVTPAAVGYVDWTQISADGNAGNYVFEARGIAVNRNPNSLYYGRVFVANASPGLNPGNTPGDTVGIIKLNADGSFAAEGATSTGGYPWAGDFYSPWKVEISDDDRVYVGDFSANGQVASFDQTIATNSMKLVLRSDNWLNFGVNFNGPFITGTGTYTQVWMADNSSPGLGIRRWNVNAAGVIASNDFGATIVQSGVVSNLDLYPFDVALDRSNRIYAIQNVLDTGSSLSRLLRFPPSTNSTPLTNADWVVGRGDDTMGGAHGVAVDPTTTYVAVAFRGVFDPMSENGGVRVYYATNGALVATPTPVPSPSHQYLDTTWDNAGNLYATDNIDSVWRAYSPPGSNAMTTVAIPAVVVNIPVPPVLSKPGYAGGQFQFTLTGQANVSYVILGSTNLQTWVPVVTNSDPPATRVITVPAPTARRFFRAQVAP